MLTQIKGRGTFTHLTNICPTYSVFFRWLVPLNCTYPDQNK